MDELQVKRQRRSGPAHRNGRPRESRARARKAQARVAGEPGQAPRRRRPSARSPSAASGQSGAAGWVADRASRVVARRSRLGLRRAPEVPVEPADGLLVPDGGRRLGEAPGPAGAADRDPLGRAVRVGRLDRGRAVVAPVRRGPPASRNRARRADGDAGPRRLLPQDGRPAGGAGQHRRRARGRVATSRCGRAASATRCGPGASATRRCSPGAWASSSSRSAAPCRSCRSRRSADPTRCRCSPPAAGSPSCSRSTGWRG